MNYEELIKKLPKHPFDAMQNGFGKTVTDNSFYLYEIHQLHHDFYESHVWILNNIEEFNEFLIFIVFSDIAFNCENEDFIADYGELDYSARFKHYQSLLTRDWNFVECKNFIAQYKGDSEIEFIEFGKISDLLDFTQADFEKCRNHYATIDEIENQGLTHANYRIMNKFHDISILNPASNQKLFLEMLENWES